MDSPEGEQDIDKAHEGEQGPGLGPQASRSLFSGLVSSWPHFDPVLYAMYAGACVLYAAIAFYGAMHQQTGGVWSAPLDDVFIHFDYARATARGYPFQWSEGNGFSSGNTSLLYPFVLALGYLIGFDGLLLMQWAAIVACVSAFTFLLVAGRLFEPLGPWAKYLLPPVALSVGALDWSLFSGMENAFHLGVWALCIHCVLKLIDVALANVDVSLSDRASKQLVRFGWLSGVSGALLFLTRPESVVSVAALGVFAALYVARTCSRRAGFTTLLRIGLPGAVTFAAQAMTNRLFTGEWVANGAIAKLALNNPYMTAAEKWDTYTFLLKYVVLRNTQHHFADQVPWGWIVVVVALIPLLVRATRGIAVLLWIHIAGWLALVALNGQVRWQNERYTMAAVAWLLLLAAMGLAVLVKRTFASAQQALRLWPPRKPSLFWALRIASAVTIAILFWWHQLPNMRDQIWFFGRASRNIRDQHIVAGRLLKEMKVNRALVGDAGALIYASDRPGLDLIGLGGYHDLPFARASVHGLGAVLELIERIPVDERPDVMAIYPSWWGLLPQIFGQELVRVPVVGNVICGGSEKVIYRADWSPLRRQSRPFSIDSNERIVDELDIADLVSERAHGYIFPTPQMGFVDFRVLEDPQDRKRDQFDAGRVIPRGQSDSALLHAPREPGRLIVRTASSRPVTLEVKVNEQVMGQLTFRNNIGWSEAALPLPADLPQSFTLTLTPLDNDWLNCHLWIVEPSKPAMSLHSTSMTPPLAGP